MICTQEQSWSAECKSPFGSSNWKRMPRRTPPTHRPPTEIETATQAGSSNVMFSLSLFFPLRILFFVQIVLHPVARD